MSDQGMRPSRVWYWAAGAMAVGAVVWLVLSLVLGFRSLSGQIDGFQRVSLPGQSEVSFTEPGDYVLYYEGRGAAEGTLPQATVSLGPVGGDGAVQLNEYSGSLTYDLSGHSGRAVLTFHIDTPGRFVLGAESAVQPGEANLAVGKTIGGAIVGTVVLALVGAAVLFLAGVALAVVVAIRRRRARRVPPVPGMEAGTTVPVPGSQV